jgi:aspartate aminotransferase-like enzyme
MLAKLMYTNDDVVMMTGEGMLALWAALKSCLVPGDSVVCVGTGVFGDGMADMARAIGCTVTKVSFPYDSTIGNGDSLAKIEEAVKAARPKMITAVHCETPSGTLNPLADVGEIKRRYKFRFFTRMPWQSSAGRSSTPRPAE